MQNFYPNAPTPNGTPLFDQYGNLVGYSNNVQQQPQQPQSNRIGTPDWWPRNNQNQQVYQQAPQQQNSQPQTPAMQGKWVKAENDIVPMDIPQDGSVVVFPQTDLQVIYLKKWEGNGTITTVPYIPNVSQDSQPQVDPVQQFQETVNGRLSNIERALDALINAISQPAPQLQPTRGKAANKEETK